MDKPEDIVAQLEQLANLKPGDSMPLWLHDETMNWAKGMSEVLQTAADEIKRLRKL